jgi:hypothetical protein
MKHVMTLLVFGALAVLAAAGDVTRPRENAGEPGEALTGKWQYWAVLTEENGKQIKAAVSGDLEFFANGTWKHNRTTGGITNPGKGAFTLSKKDLTLSYDNAATVDHYFVSFGSQQDEQDSRTSYRTLHLLFKGKDSSGTYVLRQKTGAQRGR